MIRNDNDNFTDEELRKLFHNDHVGAFSGYLSGSRHALIKAKFLFEWIKPEPSDYLLECGSSSGKTCIDLTLRSDCRSLGVDFSDEAVRFSSKMLEAHFPQLIDRCEFMVGDLTSMEFESGITKILMPDFTEHIPDRILFQILNNIRQQFSKVDLYIYTPCRSHIFEILKHRNIFLKNPPGHINVKSRKQLTDILESEGWTIVSSTWHYSSMWYMIPIELVLAPIPIVGKYFQRRIAIVARPNISS